MTNERRITVFTLDLARAHIRDLHRAADDSRRSQAARRRTLRRG